MTGFAVHPHPKHLLLETSWHPVGKKWCDVHEVTACLCVHACPCGCVVVGGVRGALASAKLHVRLSDLTSSLSFRWLNTHAVITLVCWEPLSAAKVFVTENKDVFSSDVMSTFLCIQILFHYIMKDTITTRQFNYSSLNSLLMLVVWSVFTMLVCFCPE